MNGGSHVPRKEIGSVQLDAARVASRYARERAEASLTAEQRAKKIIRARHRARWESR